MAENIEAKGILGAIIGVMSFMYGCINEIIVILALFMVMDYITGVVLALMEGKFCRSLGTKGAVKKLGYIILVVVGFLADFTITLLVQKTGIKFNTNGSLGLLVVLYLIGNEGLSITKNLIGMGLPAPPFLVKSFGLMQDTANKLGGGNSEDN